MRHILIDTDTGSDDVWAIIAALRATEDVHVDAITVVCGNVPLEICVKNALIATEVADTYFPPVYSGMSRPIVKEKLFSADYVHGSDGLGEMNLPYPAHQPEKQHAVDALVEHIMASDGELELITLGPLLIAFSLTVSTQIIRSASEGVDAAAVLWGMAVLQFAVQVASYTFLYKFVPNCHVQMSHALIGGVSASIAGLAVREAFGHYVSAGTLSTIYGAFVAFPVLLLWFYVSWLIVFGGAAITATIPLLTSGRFADSYKRGNEFLTGVALLKTLWRHRKAGETSVGITTLASEVDSYPQAVRRILLRLASKGYCVEIMSEKPKSHSDWALLCEPSEKTLHDACTVLLVDGTNHLTSPKRIASSRDEGMLFGWFRNFTAADMLSKPLDEVFSIDEEQAE